MKKFIYWLPRVLAILFIIFISIFALDVLGESQWFLALIIHLIPSFILIALTIIAWKRERLGGALFVVAGVLMLILSGFESYIIFTPAIVIGALFLIGGYAQKN